MFRGHSATKEDIGENFSRIHFVSATLVRRCPLFPQVYVIGTPNPRLPASSPGFRRLSFAPRFSCRYFGTCPTQSPSAACRQLTIALRWFSEFSEISTVFR
jgi:hypothetical protein